MCCHAASALPVILLRVLRDGMDHFGDNPWDDRERSVLNIVSQKLFDHHVYYAIVRSGLDLQNG